MGCNYVKLRNVPDFSPLNEISGVHTGTESTVDGDDTVKRCYEEQLEQEVATSSGSLSRSSSVEVIAERISSKGSFPHFLLLLAVRKF